jgi:hypothetical protein
VALTVLAWFPPVAAAQSDLTGTWELTLTAPTGPSTFEVKVSQTGETIAGELVTPMGNAAFKGTFIKDVLAVSAPLLLQGNTINLVFDGKLVNDELSGNVKFGDFGEAPWSGKRKAASAPAATAARLAPAKPAAGASAAPAGGTGIAGSWNLEVEVPGNPLPMSAQFAQEGNIVTGTISGAQGETKITGTMTGSTLKVDFYAPGGMTITMTGELKGDTLGGKAVIAGIGELDWTGTRAK